MWEYHEFFLPNSLGSFVYLNSCLLGGDCQLIACGIFTGMQDGERRGP